MTQKILIIGAGGHAAVVADALLATGHAVIGFTDNDPRRHGHRILDLPIIGADAGVLANHDRSSTVLANGLGGIKDLELRRRAQIELEGDGWTFMTVRHPSSIVSPSATISAGAQLLAGSVVQVDARIGERSIVNTRAVVEHHCIVGRDVHVAPGAVICGNVQIADDCHIGAGAVVRQGVQLGPRTVVGAGAVVIENFSGGMVLGVPARPFEMRR